MTQSLAPAARDALLLPPGASLARLLATLDAAPPTAGRERSAERLAGWFEWRDAIALSEVLNAPITDTDAEPPDTAVLAREARRLHARLDALTGEPPAAPVRPGPLSPRLPVVADSEPLPAVLRQRHLAAQREMDRCIADLRQRLRQALVAASPVLARLAALDAVMERVVGQREQLLLGSVPERLDKVAPADARTLLRAELALRWQPVEALLDALAAG